MKITVYLFFIAAIIPALILSSCGPNNAAANVAASKLSRVLDPNVPAADRWQLVAGNTAFAFDLYQPVRASDENLVYSP